MYVLYLLLFLEFLLAGCNYGINSETRSSKQFENINMDTPDTLAAPGLGSAKDHLHGYLGSHLVFQLNLKRADRQSDNRRPLIPFRKHKKESGIGSGERIPYVVYYAPSSATRSGMLASVIPGFIIQLDNDAVSAQIPRSVHKELASRGIDYQKVQTLVTISILPKENAGDAPIRTNPLSLFPHNWVHDEISATTDRSIQVASGLFGAHGVSTDSQDIKTKGPIGHNKLESYGAYIHPSGFGRPSFSSRQALFQLDPSTNVSDFWALSIDIDDTSSHKGSAILMYHIIFTGRQRHQLHQERLFLRLNKIINERGTAVDAWLAELDAKKIPYENAKFPKDPWPAPLSAQDISDDFNMLDINLESRARIGKLLRSLFSLKSTKT